MRHHGRALWMRGLAAALAVVGAGGGAALAQTADKPADAVSMSCDTLPTDAVRNVPEPFSRYVRLSCTRSGQALGPVSGYNWFFEQGPMALLANNPKTPTASAYYTRLEVDPLSPKEIDILRGDLRKMSSDPSILEREVLRLDATMSWGGAKQIYLLLPPQSAPQAHVLGMECVKNCRPINQDPWFFTVVPAG